MTAGTPALKIPAFSNAIDSRVVPRYSTWSMPMAVTPAASGLTTFVASSRPPSPVSITATSTSERANQSNAIAVVASKNVAPVRSTSGVQRPMKSTTYCSSTGRPSMRNRSRKSTRCGEVYFPTRNPRCRNTASSVAHTLPFPLVPATWRMRSRSCGSPSADSRAAVRSSPNRDPPVVRSNR